MNLFQALILPEATTVSVNMVPTKKFFKAVLLIEAPISVEQAGLLHCEFLFDAAGNARAFEGAYRPSGDLSGAVVTVSGKSTAAVVLKTEKVAHFALQREEKKGMTVTVRIHLKEGEPEELLPLLQFLNTLNKGTFEAKIEDSQIPLIRTEGDGKDDPNVTYPQPDESGLYSVSRATVRPFGHKKPALKAELQLMTLEDGFISGWMIQAGFEKPSAGGEALLTRSTVFASEREAFEHAGRELLAFTRQDTFLRNGKAEDKAYGALLSWLFDMLPELTKDEVVA